MPPRKKLPHWFEVAREMLKKDWKEMFLGLGIMISVGSWIFGKLDLDKMFGFWMPLVTMYLMLINKRKNDDA